MSEKEKKDDAMELCRLREENARLKFSLDKEKECREAERKGRIAAEKSLRNEGDDRERRMEYASYWYGKELFSGSKRNTSTASLVSVHEIMYMF